MRFAQQWNGTDANASHRCSLAACLPDFVEGGRSRSFVMASVGAGPSRIWSYRNSTVPTSSCLRHCGRENVEQRQPRTLPLPQAAPHSVDPVVAAHLARHPTPADLRSPQSLEELETQALILHDTTNLVEVSHAGVKREQSTHEQTHLEATSHASARKIARTMREHLDSAWFARVRASLCTASAPRPQKRNKRKHSAWLAWVRENVRGRRAVQADSNSYRLDMRNPGKRAFYEQKAREMTVATAAGHLPRHRRGWERLLRNVREKVKRHHPPKPW